MKSVTNKSMLYIYPSLGGAYSMERYASGLANALVGLNVPFKLVSLPQHRGKLTYLLIKYLIYPLKALILSTKGQHLIVSERYSYLIPFLKKKRTTVILHDLHTLHPDSGTSTFHTKQYLGQIDKMMRAKNVICVSDYTRRELFQVLKIDPTPHVATVHNGLEPFWFNHNMDSVGVGVEFPKTAKVLLAVGTDAWYKQFDLSLRLLSVLPDDYVLLKIGPISEKNRSLAREMGVLERLVVKERVSDQCLISAYKSSFCLLFPSLSEGFGWPAAEAMAVGCPVVTTGKGAIREVCGNAAVYFTGMEDCIESVLKLEDPSFRESLIEKGIVQSRKYNWNSSAEQILNLIMK